MDGVEPSTYLDAMKKSGIGVYAVANWDEAGTKTGAFLTFKHLGGQSKLLVGPAAHCGWAQVKTDTGFDIVTEELRFFDYWLKGVKNGVMEEPAVTYYTYNAPPAAAWRRAATWPLANEARTTFYLGERALSRTAPAAAGSDVVGLNRLEATTTSTTAPAETRGAKRCRTSADTDLRRGGDRTSGGTPVDCGQRPDVDMVARLDDVGPDGRTQSFNMHGQFRASRRALATAPYDNLGLPWHGHRAAEARPLVPGEPVEIEFDLLPMSYIFKAGHTLRLTLFFADPSAPTAPDAATRVTVFRAPGRASSVILPIVAASAAPTSGRN